jgi:hypothetical protein
MNQPFIINFMFEVPDASIPKYIQTKGEKKSSSGNIL